MADKKSEEKQGTEETKKIDIVPAKERERGDDVERTRGETFVTPRTDIYETDAGLVLVADVAGVPTGGAELNLHDGVLEITAHRAASGSSSDAARRGRSAPEAEHEPVYREYEPASYYRAFSLSDEIDSEKIDARLADGVLTVDLPRSPKAMPRRIDVKAG